MKNKILYIEDQNPKSLVDDLNRNGLQVDVNNADDFYGLLETMGKGYDAYLLDYILTSNKGRVDAPTVASTIRSIGQNHQKAPIILITDEVNIPFFEKDFTSQDLFDFVVTKAKFRKFLPQYSHRILSFISAYKGIQDTKYNISKILGIPTSDVKKYIDYRLIKELELRKGYNDTYAFCRLINHSLIRGVGTLVGENILAARLGVDVQTSDDWNKLKSCIEDCKYTGVLSSSYERWWFDRVMKIWDGISEGKSLRRTNASDKVKILNDHFKLSLKSANPSKHSKSSNFWTACIVTGKPLDPSEGFVVSIKEMYDWQEMEYISIEGIIKDSNYMRFLSPIDRKELLTLR